MKAKEKCPGLLAQSQGMERKGYVISFIVKARAEKVKGEERK